MICCTYLLLFLICDVFCYVLVLYFGIYFTVKGALQIKCMILLLNWQHPEEGLEKFNQSLWTQKASPAPRLETKKRTKNKTAQTSHHAAQSHYCVSSSAGIMPNCQKAEKVGFSIRGSTKSLKCAGNFLL